MAKKNDKNAIATSAANDLVARFGHEVEYLFSPRYSEAEKGQVQTNPYAGFNPDQKAQISKEATIMLLAQLTALKATENNEPKDFGILAADVVKSFMLYVEGYYRQLMKMKKEAQNGTSPS